MATAFRCALLRNPASAVLANIQKGRIHPVVLVADIGAGCEPAGSVFPGVRAVAGAQQSIAPRNKVL